MGPSASPTSPRARNADRTATVVCIVLAVVVLTTIAAFTIKSFQTKPTPPENAQRPRSHAEKGLPAFILHTFRLVSYGAKSDMTEIDVERGSLNTTRPESIVVEEQELKVPQTAHCREDGTAINAPAPAKGADLPPEVGQSECSICMHTFNMNDKIRVLPCKHDFHQACIDPWLVGFSGTCPVW
ncbi:hypothetical protein LTS07_000825 [Exophiala sideris]|uniref:RING-type domain-containing protein n=1 Tax=Exophiala sideris TaxID=1016849 RepID=A0ABR0JRV3_9EURO|nr:hypothetical protein LTS07_000825 [Exophiala sideris]KAK5068705.1 hypothetical protein LTR69_000826 [Exophiala sideris]KAK5186303.1 hypothetical protein LTR44_001359 [Eurotiomycetes sp. CCFEE 6388]